ncbi:hypothetical protein DAMNIGENAA_27900 [Desulforhabdus amnigena]|jgi:hypothetical protein|uniref:Uncharacterized protein n=1 Tax=Desulforhabdus amnigena TaxID=40218 RepID=A0A9W6FV24_9BACT|nr:hypothetical protein DAMNIGENAA_27900 [Desulforhabdus amnigena]
MAYLLLFRTEYNTEFIRDDVGRGCRGLLTNFKLSEEDFDSRIYSVRTLGNASVIELDKGAI